MALTNEEEQELNVLLQKIDNYDQMNKVQKVIDTLGARKKNFARSSVQELNRADQLQKEVGKPETGEQQQEKVESQDEAARQGDKAVAGEKAAFNKSQDEAARQGDKAVAGEKAAFNKSQDEAARQGDKAVADYSWAKGMADIAKKNAIKPSIQSVFSSGGSGDESNFESRSNVVKEGSKENPILASTLTVEKQAQLPAGTYIKDSKGRVRKLEQNEIDWANSKLQKSKPTTQQKDANPYAMNVEDGKKDEGRGGVTDAPMTEKDYESPEEKAAREAEERKQFNKSEGILYYTDKNGVEKPVVDYPMKNLSMNQIAWLFAAAKKEGDEEKQKALQNYIYEDPARRVAAIEWQKNHSKK